MTHTLLTYKYLEYIMLKDIYRYCGFRICAMLMVLWLNQSYTRAKKCCKVDFNIVEIEVQDDDNNNEVDENVDGEKGQWI